MVKALIKLDPRLLNIRAQLFPIGFNQIKKAQFFGKNMGVWFAIAFPYSYLANSKSSSTIVA